MPSRSHEFKTEFAEFQAVKRGDKRAEYRDLKDRDAMPTAGDIMILREIDSNANYTGIKITTVITHVQTRLLPPYHGMISFQIIPAQEVT